MGSNKQAKHRQQGRSLRRKAASKKSADRILIICEGSKTEPQYLNEIRQELRLPTTHLYAVGAAEGNDPLNVVNYAEKIFIEGDPYRQIDKKAFDQVVAVFDRDDHSSYHAALTRAETLNYALSNDVKVKVPFEVCVSVPCFELWLLLHFENVHSPIHRTEVYSRLSGHIPSYKKGSAGIWTNTKSNLSTATQRSRQLTLHTKQSTDVGPYTDMHSLVYKLLNLTSQPV